MQCPLLEKDTSGPRYAAKMGLRQALRRRFRNAQGSVPSEGSTASDGSRTGLRAKLRDAFGRSGASEADDVPVEVEARTGRESMETVEGIAAMDLMGVTEGLDGLEAGEGEGRGEGGEDASVDNDVDQDVSIGEVGRFVESGEAKEGELVNDGHVEFVVPEGWVATRAADGFSLSSGLATGFIVATEVEKAVPCLMKTSRLGVFDTVTMPSSPVFEARRRVAVVYTAHESSGRGVALFDAAFEAGACVWGLCGPRHDPGVVQSAEESLLRTVKLIGTSTSKRRLKVGVLADDGSGAGMANDGDLHYGDALLPFLHNCSIQ